MFRQVTQAAFSIILASLACASIVSAAPQEKEKKAPAASEKHPSKKAALPSSKSADDAALAKIDEFIKAKVAAGEIDKKQPGWKTKMPFPPELQFDKSKNYFWNLRTTKGDIKIRFMPEAAPMHVSSSIYLIRSGFYNDLIFHRVIPGFMAQGGCPLGKGSGSPGYKYDGETSPKFKHTRPGLLSMANAGPGTDGSQFFLTFSPTSWLDGKHTIFGEVVDGMSVVKALEAQGTRGGKTRERLEMIASAVSVEPRKKKAEGN